jgi:hypothetical protein
MLLDPPATAGGTDSSLSDPRPSVFIRGQYPSQGHIKIMTVNVTLDTSSFLPLVIASATRS